MQKIIFSLCFCLISSFSIAQPVYQSSDFAEIGDEFVESLVLLENDIDAVRANGMNISWDFSQLSPDAQTENSWVDPDSGNYSSFWCILNGIFLGCEDEFQNLTNLAQSNANNFLAELEIDQVNISDVLLHYKKTESSFSLPMLGVTAELNGTNLSVPVTYQQPDTLYRFPIQMGNRDTSNSFLFLDLNQFFIDVIYTSRVERINEVDAWGQLRTPFANYSEVIRLKSTLTRNDTVINMGQELPIIDTTMEYKWFAPGVGVPVMQANTRLINGQEFVQDISYLDTLRATSIRDFQEWNTVQVYPNPTSNELNMDFGAATKDIEIRVYDLQGREERRVQLNSASRYTLALDDLAAGVYVVSIRSEDRIAVRKFIKE